ncbi:filamentous hemagglutinin N-terminal domain-containing protein [Argonema antarcticum]|uniref:two-partner secretion domain-containing protein n=1 Tax=Argonema antarcticum TaxID=2942763 RepID=UPI002011118C|nr:filamentous hemagglutinin N-terminal domain-containing protein [Argonema antarcticum]MCL1473458.1 filamentous hemagglutinin N-terminal domain-containing protein [Argonema antarcticum A004/B2]
MSQKRVIGCWTLCATSLFWVSGAIASLGDCTLAQITPDATLRVNSVVTPSLDTSIIEGGTYKGGNLFHSFKDFSVPTGGTVLFNNALDIQNIFTRVTGGSISHIDGLLKANGTANLFLLNPNGIIFGLNAQLNIGGSFLASTANSINFTDGTSFSASAPQTTSLLTISVPIGLQFGSNPGDIINRSRAIDNSSQAAGLQVQPGRTLALIGGNVSVDGGILLAPGGRVELGGLAEAGTVGLNMDGDNLSLNFPDRITRANISLTNGTEVNVEAAGGGSIAIYAKNLEISQGAVLRAGIASGLGSIDARAGDIEIDVTGALVITGTRSIIYNQVLENATGFGGDIHITAVSLTVSNGGYIYAGTRGKGNAGNVNINILGTALFEGEGINNISSAAYNRVERGATGQGGDVNITAGSLTVSNGALVQASTNGQGNAGNLNINVRDLVSFDGVGPDVFSSGAYSGVESNNAVGNGGNINISAGSLSVTNGAVVTASTEGMGNAGNITINVANAIVLSGISPSFNEILQTEQSSGIYSVVKPTGVGTGGNINITTGSLEVADGALVIARTRGQGNAGNIQINTADYITIYGIGTDKTSSALLTPTEPGARGLGGDITVNTNVFRVSDGAVINSQTLNENKGGNITINATIFEATGGGQAIATTSSSGQAGNITINATDKIILSGSDPNFVEREGRFDANIVGNNEGPASGLYASTAKGQESTGAGGNLTIQARGQMIVTEGAQVTVSAQGTGAAGNLEVAASSIHLDNGFMTATTTAGNFGNINLRSQGLVLRNGSRISTDATQGTANGGNITIDTGVLAGLENSDIIAKAIAGRGGNILIYTQGDFRSIDSEVSASSERGINGVVDIQTPNTNPTQGLLKLPQVPIASSPPAQGCRARGRQTRFINTGSGGVPPNPSDALSSNIGWVDSSTRESNLYNPKTYSSFPEQIVEAQGWIINPNGVVELTASPSVVTPNNSGSVLPACN